MTVKNTSSFTDADIGEVSIKVNRRAKRVSIRVKADGTVCITIPRPADKSGAMAFFQSKKAWIIKCREKMRLGQAGVKNRKYTQEELDKIAREAQMMLPYRTQQLARRYGFEFNTIRLKNNKSNWGSCSTKKNINLNIFTVILPAPLRDYVIIHELCHLRHMNHGPYFHDILERYTLDNLRRLAADKEADLFSGGQIIHGDPLARELLKNIASSKSQYPVFSEIRKAMKSY